MAFTTTASTMALRPGSSCVSRATPLSRQQRFSAAPSLQTRRQVVRSRVTAAASGSEMVSMLGPIGTLPVASDASREIVANQVYTIADQISPETAATISAVLGPVFAVGTLLMTIRIITTWYPETDGRKMPWLLVYFPTEWILAPTRKVVPPSFGVDVSPVVWVAIISFANEILLGPQGILNLIIRQQLASS